ncbi:MAG TPA: hypothetical protein VGN82_08300 [Bosea sp. (in: a-proteobacteria)]|jgi:hypothetical protein|uniref:hypothetical protein n=1 Tax=Bosea sp. (in: a-proteobacteria) TaxID=1871050 RepID=UPI002E10DDA4|nr:hypothetical protein [Bosea sp. (in: a-proteobacteria)]
MTPEQLRGLERLQLRWPERRYALATVSEPLLLELCADYEAASVAMALWAQKPGLRDLGVVEEYRRLLKELEDELEAALAPK